MLDTPRSDFYIHFDKKVRTLPEIRVEKGNLHILEKRIDVCWGTVSQIKTELLLLETALGNGPYGHYHILSGTHLPLKPVEDLFAFYDSHSGEEIMRFWPQDEGDADFKLRRYHYPMRYFKRPGHPVRKAFEIFVWKGLLKIQKIFGIRHLTQCNFQKTDNWVSLSEQGCAYLIQYKNKISKKYRWAFCGDEYFAASELLARPDIIRVFNCPQLLHVEFHGDSPKTFSFSEYLPIQQTGALWARKFSSNVA